MHDSSYLTRVRPVNRHNYAAEISPVTLLLDDVAKPIRGTTLQMRLVEAMAEAELSRNKLEQLADLGRGYISKLMKGERGSSIELATASAIAEALNVSIDWLFYARGPKREQAPDLSKAAPVRERARTIAFLCDITDEAVNETLEKYEGEQYDTKPALWWLDKMQRTEKRLWMKREQIRRMRERDERRARETPSPKPPSPSASAPASESSPRRRRRSA